MGCEAQPRPKVRPMGWKCQGVDLVQMYPASKSLPPLVAPRWAVDFLVAEAFRPDQYDVREFPGGDHLHAVVQRGAEMGHLAWAAEADVPVGFVSQR